MGDLRVNCRLEPRMILNVVFTLASVLLHNVTLGSMETLFAHFRLAEQEEGQFYYAILLDSTFN
jgi:hypothetical protein